LVSLKRYLSFMLNLYNNYNYYNEPPLCSSGQGSWLQIQRSWFDYLRYQIF
jgi:hypothetical protein